MKNERKGEVYFHHLFILAILHANSRPLFFLSLVTTVCFLRLHLMPLYRPELARLSHPHMREEGRRRGAFPPQGVGAGVTKQEVEYAVKEGHFYSDRRMVRYLKDFIQLFRFPLWQIHDAVMELKSKLK